MLCSPVSCSARQSLLVLELEGNGAPVRAPRRLNGDKNASNPVHIVTLHGSTVHVSCMLSGLKVKPHHVVTVRRVAGGSQAQQRITRRRYD